MNIVSVVRNINRGGFGVIDEVVCEDGQHYARKTFSPSSQFSVSPELCEKFKKRFSREVNTQMCLPVDLFIPIIYADLDCESPWFIMPIAEGVYTDEINACRREGRNPEGLGDILNSLEFLHGKGLVHRDLKPQNILKHEGVWKLADFGLITQDREILSQTTTTSNQFFGTLNYCAPEQIIEFKRVNNQADIYSFGAILHDIFGEEQRVPHDELSARGEIGIIIEKCTKRKKEHRFKDVSSLRSRLLYVLSHKPIYVSTEQTDEWLEDFKDTENWDYDKFEGFVFYLKRHEDAQGVFFFELDNEVIENLSNIDKELFDDFCIVFLDWVYNSSFDFDYCDVIIGYIRLMYDLTDDLEVKANAVVSAAELGRSHNRWYVMRKVVGMANNDISSDLAFRICIEISINNRNKSNFIRCVEMIRWSINNYHDIIREALMPVV